MLIVIDARESGTSTGRYIDKLIEHMHKLKPTFEIVVLTKSHRVDYFRKVAPNFTVRKSDYKEFTFGEQLGLARQIKSFAPDLVHFSIVQQPILYRGKTITTMHDLTTARFRNPDKNLIVFTLKQQIYKFVNWYVPHKATRVIVPSQYTRSDVASFAHVNRNKLIVTYEAVDPIKDKPEAIKALLHQPFIMYVGRPTPHKNLERLVEAFTILQVRHSDLKLVLAGKQDTNYQRLQKQIESQGIKNVIFTGFINDGHLRWLYEHCQAYVFPSLSEGFGLPGLEAMEHGAPVISSNATSLPEVYGPAAAYFNPNDSQAMADTIDTVLSSATVRKKLISAGKEQVKKYSWDRMAEQTLAVYTDILGPLPI